MHRYATPFGVFLLLVILLGVGLTMDPRRVPSPLIGKPLPEFDIPTLRDPQRRFSQGQLRDGVSLLNVWATWCVPCRQEHPVLVGIEQRDEAVIFGLNYKDERDKAVAWLNQLGDPYRLNGFDLDGRTGIDLGVYGVPETFVVDAQGNVVHKHIGPIDEKTWKDELLPLIRRIESRRG